MHRRAIKLGVSGDMALDFSRDLKQFKQNWRSTQGFMSMQFEDKN